MRGELKIIQTENQITNLPFTGVSWYVKVQTYYEKLMFSF